MRLAPALALTAVLAAAGAAGAALAIVPRDGGERAAAPRPASTSATATPPTPALCRPLRTSVTGRVPGTALNELSGLVESRVRPGVLHTHEDSGAASEIHALRADGTLLGTWTVPGAQAVDWEDIATGPAPGGGAVLYLADIGDNRGVRPSVAVYRVAEPAPGTTATAPAERLTLRYPDGPHDAETLLVDPRRGTLVVVTKELQGGRAYTAAAVGARAAFGGEVTLTRGPAVEPAFATGGDVSADGRIVAIRGYSSIAVYARRGAEPLTTTLRRRPCSPPTSFFEGQGEAIALNRDGTAARTVAEGTPATLRRYAPTAGR